MITSKEWGAQTTTIAMRHEYDNAARAFCHTIPRRPGFNGAIVVNFDTKEWYEVNDNADGWRVAREKWGEKIAHPPIYMINSGGQHRS